MKILSMTATFGKLSGQTITFRPDMNIIEAPNEWGKSTWCAFLMAMLYGIETAERTKMGKLADKEHYAPWSGAPMSGRMDILWDGHGITIERQSKGRVPLGEVRAFETETGIPVPALCVAAPGQVLLGVERSVFARAGFLRQSEMPVTADESLRRRLNELVTTGDESGASDALAQKLKELKNRCRHNKTGLLPEAEAQLQAVRDKLSRLDSLQQQAQAIKKEQETLQAQLARLENHRQALAYRAYEQYARKLAAAQTNCDGAAEALKQAETACAGMPPAGEVARAATEAERLKQSKLDLQTKSNLVPPAPAVPQAHNAFCGKSPETAEGDAVLHRKVLMQLENDRKKPVSLIAGAVCLALALVLAGLSQNVLMYIGAGALLIAGAVWIVMGLRKQKKLKKQIAELREIYRGIAPDHWVWEAGEYAHRQREYDAELSAHRQALALIDRGLEQNAQETQQLTGGQELAAFEALCRSRLAAYAHLADCRSRFAQANAVLQALGGAVKQVSPPAFADELTLSAEETDARIVRTAADRERVQQTLGHCCGQMEALGSGKNLRAEQVRLTERIAQLEQYCRALTCAQQTLEQATQTLQRRFAPRISKRAQELFCRMTGGRYQRLNLMQDLSVEAGAEGENTVRSTLWRSDGTVDQLYLALRLAVAEALTPEAPLVLDDALVRFDDTRLAAALEILREFAENKQVILFTCQSRENKL